MRVLLVEDDVHLGPQLQALLGRVGFAVDLAVEGRSGLFQGCEYPYDAAVIDLGLPGISGITLIQRLRAAGHNYPILILTARGHWQDKVEGLEAGADDYLTKPFQAEELHARLKALIRRAAGVASAQLQAGPLLLSCARKTVSLHGQPLELTSYEYNILEYLMLHRGEVISNPRLVTTNQREAVIKQGREVGYLTITGSGSGGNAAFQRLPATAASIQVERIYVQAPAHLAAFGPLLQLYQQPRQSLMQDDRAITSGWVAPWVERSWQRCLNSGLQPNSHGCVTLEFW